MKLPLPDGQVGQISARILETPHHDMNDLALAFDAAVHEEDHTMPGDGAGVRRCGGGQ